MIYIYIYNIYIYITYIYIYIYTVVLHSLLQCVWINHFTKSLHTQAATKGKIIRQPLRAVFPKVFFQVSYVGVSQVFCLFYYLLCERLLFIVEELPYIGWLIILSLLFIFNLTRKKIFVESTLRWWIFDKYLVLHQLFI